jgi:methyl-accepting chemotaxis protein
MISLKTKMIGTVIMLAALAVVLAGVGVSSLSSIHRAASEANEASTKLELAFTAQVELVTWFRSTETLIRADATPEIVAQGRKDADGAYKRLTTGLNQLSDALVTTEGRSLMARIKDLIAQYRGIETKADQLYDQHQNDDLLKAMHSGATIDNQILDLLTQIVTRNDETQGKANDRADRTYDEASTLLWGVSAGGILVFLALGLWVIVVGVSRPLDGVTRAMTAVAGGDLDAEVPGLGQGDEIGRLAAALDTFKRNGLERREMAADRERQQKAAVEEKRRTMNQLADGFESSVRAVVEALSQAVTQLQADAQGLSATADQTNRQAVAVAAAAEQATSNVQTVAAATEELSSSVNEISRQVSESSRIAGVAVDEANKTNVTVAGLSEAAQKIGEVVGLINNIASQTNLLALNATIEAARAGEAGKGFAVVASEVKNLANQTAKATDDIQGQVGQMQAVTGTAVDAIKGITGTIQRMSEITTTIASAVEEQGAATREIARNVQQASTGTREVSSNISGVTQAAGETGHMAGSVLGAAKELSRQTDRLRQEVDAFVRRVRNS